MQVKDDEDASFSEDVHCPSMMTILRNGFSETFSNYFTSENLRLLLIYIYFFCDYKNRNTGSSMGYPLRFIVYTIN